MADKKVIIYSTEWCAFCKDLKAFLDSKGVAWEEKDVEHDASAYHELTEKMGEEVRAVPVSDVFGTMIIGFDRPAIEKALASQ